MGVTDATPDLKWPMRASGPAQNVPPRPPRHSGQGQPSWALDESRHPRTRCSRSTGSSPGCFLELISWSSPLQHRIDGAAAAAGAPHCCQPGTGLCWVRRSVWIQLSHGPRRGDGLTASLPRSVAVGLCRTGSEQRSANQTVSRGQLRCSPCLLPVQVLPLPSSLCSLSLLLFPKRGCQGCALHITCCSALGQGLWHSQCHSFDHT